MAIGIGERAGRNDAVGDGDGLETEEAGGWEVREGFMDTAAPVGEIGVGQGVDGGRRGLDVHLVIARQLTFDGEVSKI